MANLRDFFAPTSVAGQVAEEIAWPVDVRYSTDSEMGGQFESVLALVRYVEHWNCSCGLDWDEQIRIVDAFGREIGGSVCAINPVELFLLVHDPGY